MSIIYFLKFKNASAEENAAKNWLVCSFPNQTKIVTFADLFKKAEDVNPGNLIWIHSDRIGMYDTVQIAKLKEMTVRLMSRGVGLFCTGLTAELPSIIGLERNKPDIMFRKNWRKETGEHQIRGIFGYPEHPVFSPFFGGIYTWRPTPDENYSMAAYSGTNCPKDCKVIGVERFHLGFEDSLCIMWERSFAKGMLLCVGAYTCFAMQDKIYQNHLSQFIKSCFSYLRNGKIASSQKTYFEPKEKGIICFSEIEFSGTFPEPDFLNFCKNTGFEVTKPDLNFWDLTGKTGFAIGREKSGIEEIWFHPFQALRNFQWKLVDKGEVLPAVKFTAYQDRIERKFVTELGELKETVVCLQNEPVVLLRLETNSKSEMKIRFEMNSDLRFMWPFKPGVLGKIAIQINKSSLFLFDENQENLTAIVARQPFISAHFSDISNKNHSEIFIDFELNLSKSQPIQIAIFGSNKNLFDGVNQFKNLLSQLNRILANQKNRVFTIEQTGGKITTPDEQVNRALKYAGLKLDSFVSDISQTGKGLFAGYGTTLPGWFSSRPGYAWYFGRDSVWCAFAFLYLGRFDVVKSILSHLIKYQEFTGKIYHEMTTCGIVHYDAADSTPLFLILVGTYYFHSGNGKFIEDNWLSIKKAFEFCRQTDFDNDGFIENTDVGHGWIESGKLYGAHVTHYLTGIWIYTLKIMKDLALLMGENEFAEYCSDFFRKVYRKYQNQFWLKQGGYFAYGIDENGKPLATLTTMPSVGILFGVAESEKAKKTLLQLDRLEFCSDWGVRMISDHHPDFKPEGYHSGSIWPLYTGWQALADYKVGRAIPGWVHWMHQIPLFQYFSKGNMAEVLRGDFFNIAGICPHQAWSEAMVLLPFYQGLLGLFPDVPNNRLQINPQIPDCWPELKIEKMKFGKNLYDFHFKREAGIFCYSFTLIKGTPFSISFHLNNSPSFFGNKFFLNDKQVTPKKINGNCVVDFLLSNFIQIKIERPFYLRFIPEIYLPELGQRSTGYMVTEEKFDENDYRILIHGKSGADYKGKLLTIGLSEISVKNAEIVDSGCEYLDLFFKIPKCAEPYHFLEIKIAYRI